MQTGPSRRSSFSASLACGWLCLTGMFIAFTASAQEDEDIFELSPFTIEPEEGWVATETLAGSRLRTDYDDGPTFPVIKSVDGNNIRVARKSGRLFILSMDIDL